MGAHTEHNWRDITDRLKVVAFKVPCDRSRKGTRTEFVSLHRRHCTRCGMVVTRWMAYGTVWARGETSEPVWGLDRDALLKTKCSGVTATLDNPTSTYQRGA